MAFSSPFLGCGRVADPNTGKIAHGIVALGVLQIVKKFLVTGQSPLVRVYIGPDDHEAQPAVLFGLICGVMASDGFAPRIS